MATDMLVDTGVRPPVEKSLPLIGYDADPFHNVYTRVSGPIGPEGRVNASLATHPYNDLVHYLTYAKTVNVAEIGEGDAFTFVKRIQQKVSEQAAKYGDHLPAEPHVLVEYSRRALGSLLAAYRHHPTVLFPREAIEQVRASYDSPFPQVQKLERDNIGKLIVLDERNAEIGEGIGIKEAVQQEILDELSIEPVDVVYNRYGIVKNHDLEQRVVAYTLACGKEPTVAIMKQFISGQGQLPVTFWHIFGNALGFETMLAEVGHLASSDPSVAEKVDAISKTVGLHKGGKIFWDVGEFYKSVNFEGYTPYSELQKADEAFLLTTLQGKNHVIDIGCGEGRHMKPLAKAGFKVEGVDISLDSLPRIQKDIPDAVVQIGTMTNLPYEDNAVDAVISMGRATTHFRNRVEAYAAFREWRRVLKNGGVAAFDLPSLWGEEMSIYTREREDVLNKLGIWNKEGAPIHSSPDGKHYLDRFILDPNEIYRLARFSGFTARLVEQTPYTGPSGKSSANDYWVLTATNEPEEQLTDRQLYSDNIHDQGWYLDIDTH